MELVDDIKQDVQRNVRRVKTRLTNSMLAIAGVLSGAEAVLSSVDTSQFPIPQWARVLLIASVMGGAFVARQLALRQAAKAAEMSGEDS